MHSNFSFHDSETSSSRKRAVVNGIGIFHSWPRNFPNPRDAMFDLVDNAVDAATPEDDTNGRIAIEADDRSSGVILMNSCIAPIQPLSKVLELYTSEKQFTGAVGENGIGLKQGVVTLANVAFIISKNRSKYSLGIVAMCLQTQTECWMPSFEFHSQAGMDMEQELFTTLDSHPKLRQCVTQFGDSFLDGVNHLHKVMLRMDNSKRGWKQYPHVFCLLLHDLKHGENLIPNDRVSDLLEQTKADLPKHYLHIPKNLQMTVDKAVVKFNYWQPRLVEMTCFDFHINRSVPMEEDPWWQYPKKSYDSSKYYPIRIYIGFDAQRAADDAQPSTGSLYIYSRTCGRLIRVSEDARGEINVSNGGTDYCQGLTIILDDRGGNLPLNPTKHDVAFSEHADGVIHRANLFCYINVVTRFYYNYYKGCYFSKKKKDISDALRELLPRVKEVIAMAKHDHTPISECQFNTFNQFLCKQSNVKSNRISRLLSWKDVAVRKGKDSVLCFTKPIHPPIPLEAAIAPAAAAMDPVPGFSPVPVSDKYDDFFDDHDDHVIPPVTPSLCQRSGADAPSASRETVPDVQSPLSKKRSRSVASEQMDNEEMRVDRISTLEDELKEMKEHEATRDKEFRRMRREMARQGKLIARLDDRLKDYNEMHEC